MATDGALSEAFFAPQAPLRLLALPGVYAPQQDTRLLARSLHREALGPGTEVLDLGTGTGALAILAARTGAHVTAVDISRRAVLNARLNALLSRQSVTFRRADLTAGAEGRTYDLVISNPPYVPSPSERLPRRGAARAWDAGHDGRALVDRVCDTASTALRPDGVLLLVHSGLCETDATLHRLARAGLRGKIVDRALIPLGPVLRSRQAWLRRQGMLRSEEHEELVVIRAEHA